MLFLVVACLVEPTDRFAGSPTEFGHIECHVVDECGPVTYCCEGDQDGFDRCWYHSVVGDWDCATVDDCDAAAEVSVQATCYPPHTGDTGETAAP
jgi:hypothetical protein